MGSISTALSEEIITRIIGYKLTKGDFRTTSPNLPQRIALLGEANNANQGTLSLDPKQITTSKEAGTLYGFGSPIYTMMRILRPNSGDGVGSIPIYVYPQAEAAGAVAAARDITPSGTATANATHTVVINGRKGLDGQRYDFNVVTGDAPAAIVTKIVNAVNAVLGTVVTAADTTGKATCTTKWKGLTSEDLTISVDTNNNAAGVTYAIASSATGSGTPSVTSALNLFNNDWNTIVINPYSVTATLTELEAFNGIPDPDSPTGRYTGAIMKPFIALFGDTSTDPSTITDSRKTEVTNAVCPAPNSDGFPMEAAANMAILFSTTAESTPHLDVNAKYYSDMPVPSNGVIGAMSDYVQRDAIVKKGSSTVMLVDGKYQVQDFVTTYHPDGETPPQYRYCRNLMLDFNVRYGYYLLEEINVRDHAIANDDDIVSVDKVVKPKKWVQILNAYADDLGKRALIADVDFMKSSIQVGLSVSNPDRLETFFRYKRTGTARVLPTTAEAGFNFGTL